MAIIVVTIKIMPTGPLDDNSLNQIYEQAAKHVRNFVDEKHKDGEVRKEIEEIGFGVKAVKLLFVMDESVGGTEELENKIKEVENVQSVETTDVRRAIG